jgi:hypothetical protein
MFGEELVSSKPERGGSAGPFVREDLGVRESAVGVDRGVQEGVADVAGSTSAGMGSGRTTMHPPPAAGRDAALLLHVHVNQLATTGCGDAADDPAGRAVHPLEPVQSQAHQDTVNRRRRHTQAPADPNRSELQVLAQRGDRCLCLRRRASGRTMRPARAIDKPIDSFGLPAVPPLVCSRPRDPHLRRDMRDGPTRLDPQHHREPTKRRETTVTVQVSLPGLVVPSTAPQSPRGLNSSPDPVNKVRGHYS